MSTGKRTSPSSSASSSSSTISSTHPSAYKGGRFWHMGRIACNHLDDLLRVFHILDRKPEPDVPSSPHGLVLSTTWTEPEPTAVFCFVAHMGAEAAGAHRRYRLAELFQSPLQLRVQVRSQNCGKFGISFAFTTQSIIAGPSA
jgi:hypothetical protein